MTNRNADSSQGEGGVGNLPPPSTGAPPPGANDNRASRNGNKVYKSGPLFLSSRGIGWTSWKKRWFILTRTSLVFFRNDPSAIPQKGSEVNLTLGGIDLNSSGSVIVKVDKKLLTVLFPDGRDGNGRAFTLKAETTEDLYEWKAALEEALANAPSAALVMGQNGIFKSDQGDAADGSLEQSKDRQPAKSFVIGRPILLALEDIDGTPSFLEKALRYLEEHGVKIEGILRQAADVDDVEHRIREYEQGKTDFSAEEDPHVIADCIKYVLRELPSSPVPASCCNALLEACRTDRSMRVSAMRTAICDTFPEPNRRLLQRILIMMQAVAANKAENRMSISAVAACMAPLLLRPLLAGDCELEHNFDMGGDGSVQLLQAAAAANHAQAICITLLEEYENLFGEDSMSSELYSDTEESGSESEELSDDDEAYEDDEDGEDVTEGSDADMDEEIEGASSCTCSETGDSGDQHQHDKKGSESLSSHSNSHEGDDDLDLEASQNVSFSPQVSHQGTDAEVIDDIPDQSKKSSTAQANESVEQVEDLNPEINSRALPSDSIQRSITVANGPIQNSKRPTVWGRTGAKKNLSMENIDVPIEEDEAEIQRLEDMKVNLQNKIAAEKKGNAALQEDLENRKNALHKRRLALEQDVAKLQEQLQKEKELRAALEVGLKMPQGPAPISASINERTKADLEEIAQAEADIINLKQKTDYLEMQVAQQREQNSVHVLESSNQPQQTSNQGRVKEKERDFEASASSRNTEKLMRPKDTQVSKAQTEKDGKSQPPSLSSKSLAQNQQPDSLRDLKSAGTPAASPLVEQGVGKSSSINSRRTAPRGEAGPTSSALTKLTNRLNFLKERRNQIANELQTMDKGRNSGQAAQKQERGSRRSESPPSNVSVDKFKESEGQSSEKGRAGSDSNQYQQSIDRGGVTEGSSFQNADTHRKLEIHSLQTRDRGLRPEAQSTPNLDRGKSESFPNNEKGRAIVPPRTYSR